MEEVDIDIEIILQAAREKYPGVTPRIISDRRSLMNAIGSSNKLGNSELKLVPPNLPESPKIPSAIRNPQRILFLSSRKTGLCREATRAPQRCR